MERRIVCAANRYGKDKIVLGVRHFDALMHDVLQNSDFILVESRKEEQGFIDNRGAFLTREEAWIVAAAAGQIRQRVGGDEYSVSVSTETDEPKIGRLFSENLY